VRRYTKDRRDALDTGTRGSLVGGQRRMEESLSKGNTSKWKHQWMMTMM
jgi:hypothetical protein